LPAAADAEGDAAAEDDAEAGAEAAAELDAIAALAALAIEGELPLLLLPHAARVRPAVRVRTVSESLRMRRT
jgi:hypothetical protein